MTIIYHLTRQTLCTDGLEYLTLGFMPSGAGLMKDLKDLTIYRFLCMLAMEGS